MRAITIIMLCAILSVADADADDTAWTDEKAKSLGLPVVPIGTVVMCESEESVGFNWKNGTYVLTKFENTKRILKKAEASKCSFNPNKSTLNKGALGDSSRGYVDVCIQYKKFGEKYLTIGGVCTEFYVPNFNGGWDIHYSCRDLLLPNIAFRLNGLYHLAERNDNLTSKPNDYKDSQYIEWGRCATISD